MKTSLVSWEVITRPKYIGGLGFRDIELFNLAMLAGPRWHILLDQKTLGVRILKTRYFC